MRWPLVARSTFEEVAKQRDDFKRKYEQLLNQFVYRGTGIALDPDELPSALRPKRVTAEQHHLMDPKAEPSFRSDPRTALKRAEEAREKKYLESLGELPKSTGTVEVQSNVTESSKGA